MKPRFWRSFWDAEWVCTLIGSLVMAQNVKISVSGFYWFCKKKTRESKKGFSQLYLATERTSMDGDLYREKAIFF